MSTPLEIFQEWEDTGPFVHVMIIDRGDGAASKRLTLTDRPYYDKGVSGAKYHHTYPAPMHCILSDLVTDERMSGSTFDDIDLANTHGLLDDILSTSKNILGRRFEWRRGHPDWSLLETDFPYRFVTIAKGVIEDVLFDHGRVRLRLAPVKYRLNRRLGSIDAPVAIGWVYNTPFTLVDAATRKYRCNTLPMMGAEDVGEDFMPVRDRGVVLNPPYDMDPEFSMILEDEDLAEDAGGVFRGKIQLVLAPEGQLTCDQGNGNAGDLEGSLIKLAHNYLTEEANPPVAETDFSAYLQTYGPCVEYGDSGNKLYTLENDGSNYYLHQFSLSTAYTPATKTYEKTYNLNSALSARCYAFRFGKNGERLYVAEDLDNSPPIRQLNLSSAWDIDTIADSGKSFAIEDTGNEDADDFLVVEDGTRLIYRGDGFRYYERIFATAYEIDTLGAAVNTGVPVADAIDMSADGRKFYMLQKRSGSVLQFLLVNPYSIATRVSAGRALIHFSHTVYPELDSYAFRVAGDGSSVMISLSSLSSPGRIAHFTGLNSGDLPEEKIKVLGLVHYHVGVFYSTEVELGQVITDMTSGHAADFAVDRLGTICVIKRGVLSSFDVFDFYESDLIGNNYQAAVRHVSTTQPAEKFTVKYQRNYYPQSLEQLGSSVSLEDRDAFSREYRDLVDNVSLSGYVDPAEIVHTANVPDSIDGVEAVMLSQKSLYGQVHRVAEVDINLRSTSILSGFGLGMRFRANFDAGLIASGDQHQTVGRRINWSQGKQTVAVFK